MTDSLISAKATIDWSDLGKFDQAVNSLIDKAQGRKSEASAIGASGIRGGFKGMRSPVSPGEADKEQNVGKLGQESQARVVAAQQRYAALLEEKERRERGGTRLAGTPGAIGYTDKGITSELGKAQAEISRAAHELSTWADKVVESIQGTTRGITAIRAHPEGAASMGLRDLARRQLGREAQDASDAARAGLGIPSRYKEGLSDKLQFQQGRDPVEEARVKLAQVQTDRAHERELLSLRMAGGEQSPLEARFGRVGEAMRLSQRPKDVVEEDPFKALNKRLAAWSDTMVGATSGTKNPFARINENLASFSPSSSVRGSGNDQLTNINKRLSELKSKELESEAGLIVAQEEYARKLKAAVAVERQSQGLTGLGFGKGGTRTQQFFGWSSMMGGGGGGGRTNEDFPTAGKFLANHAGRTLGYAIPGIAIGAGFEEMRNALHESEQAQRSMSELKAQFAGLGQASQFSGFADSIKNIASQTGVAVSEVTQLGMAMKGVYGDTAQATIATNAIAQATVTMDMGLKEAQQDLTAISQGFSEFGRSGAAITKISDELLHLQDLTGVTAKSMAPGVADVASTANVAGYSFNQTASIVAAASQRSGLSSETIGETFSKIISNLSSNPQMLVSTEALMSHIPGSGVGANISTQGMSTQIQAIIQALPKLGAAQYETVLTNMGLNASALPAANALAATGTKAAQLAGTGTPQGRAEEEFKKQMDTLAGRFNQLRSDVTNLGVAILNSGIGKFLTEFANGLGLGIEGLSKINEVTHGLAGQMAGLLAVLAGFKMISGLFTALSALRAAVLANAAAEVVDTEAVEANAIVRGGNAIKGVGFGAAAGVGVAALGGYQIGSMIEGQIKGTSAMKSVNQFLATNVFGEKKLGAADVANGRTYGTELDLDNGTKRSGSTKFGAQQQEFVNQHIKQIRAVMATAPKNVRTEMQNDLNNDTYGNNYLQLLEMYSQYGQTKTGQVAVKANAPAKSMKQAAADKAAAQKAAAQRAIQMEATEASDLTGLQAAYSSGNASASQLVSLLQKNTQNYLNQFKSNPSTANYEAYTQSQQQLNQQLDQLAQQSQQSTQSILANGNPTHDIAIVQSAVTTVKQMHGPQDVMSALTTLTSDMNTLWQDQASNAVTGAQKIRAQTQSYVLPPSVVASLKASGINVPSTMQGFMSKQAQYQALGQDVQATQALAQAGAVEDPVKIAIANAQAAAANVQNALTTEGSNSDDYKQAQSALQEANQQIVDAQNQVSQAKLGMLAAMFSNDPIQAAQYSLQQLQTALADAHGAAAQQQIKGQIATQQEAIAQAQIAQGDALSAIVQATLTAQGNPIQAALVKYRQDLQDIVARKSFDMAHGVNQSQDTQLQSQIAQSISDNTNYLQTQFSTLSSNTQTELYLGQITATQAIAQLQAGMANAKGNQQLVLQYEQAIRQIQNSAGANLNFDIPQNLLINPTLYQAARVGQSGNGAYQDNRNVQVTINVNNPSNNAGAVKQIMGAIGNNTSGAIAPVVSSPLATPGS